MIQQLRAPRGAYFSARTARITGRAVATLFADLLAGARNPSRPVFRIERRVLNGMRFSALCFAYDRPVAFPVEASGRVDRVHGFLLLVEKEPVVAVLRTGLDVTSAFRKAHLAPLDRSRVERAIARHDAMFEKLSLRNLTTSRLALRTKTLEAHDLENSIAASTAGRFATGAPRRFGAPAPTLRSGRGTSHPRTASVDAVLG